MEKNLKVKIKNELTIIRDISNNILYIPIPDSTFNKMVKQIEFIMDNQGFVYLQVSQLYDTISIVSGWGNIKPHTIRDRSSYPIYVEWVLPRYLEIHNPDPFNIELAYITMTKFYVQRLLFTQKRLMVYSLCNQLPTLGWGNQNLPGISEYIVHSMVGEITHEQILENVREIYYENKGNIINKINLWLRLKES